MEGQESQGPSQFTQRATQPYQDPRRQAQNLSEMSEDDQADIICVLHANSPSAQTAIHANMLIAPEHILQNEDLDGITREDLLYDPLLSQRTREIALRMSSTVRKPREGFLFGRNPDSCDIVLTDNPRDKLVSGIHFKIFVHEQGSLLIEDCSTNGTIIDREMLKFKGRDGRPLPKSPRHVLQNGTMITVLVGQDRQEIRFMVRIPNRADYETLYEQKLKNYLTDRGFAPKFSSIRESSYGNHWTGGAIYNFTGLLGKGAFATVYKIQTKSEGTVYAAKEIDKKRFIKNGVLDIKFDNELKIMKRLKHPNIVDYIDCQIHKEWIYIIMEYVPWGELSKELALRGRIPETEAQQITRQTLRALDYLHRQSITHRDIKPDNILIASKDPLIVKLSDFGLSKTVVNEETFLKTFCGTLLYCAPEVYPDYDDYAQPTAKRRRSGGPPARTAPYNSSADMWSFGAVIFHIMAGKAPIIGRGENGGAQMLNNIMTKDVDFTPLREIAVSDDAIDFIHSLLNRHPTLRPKEQDCFLHPWLRNVPDLVDYSEVPDIDNKLQGRLEDVEEGDEAEASGEWIEDLQRWTHNNPPAPIPNSQSPALSSPARPTKKPKTFREGSDTIPEEVEYPPLPPFSQSSSGKARETSGPRLFGEITPSVLKSSGVFGINSEIAPSAAAIVATNSAVSSPIKSPDIPQMRNQMEQVSMNDFAASRFHLRRVSQEDKLARLLSASNASYVQPPVFGSAASLMGAEEQLGQMNMGSPEPAATDAPTPETSNPQTPPNQEFGPVQASGHQIQPNSSHNSSDTDVRKIDINLLSDEVAFAAEQQLRDAAREENQRLKAQSFHGGSAHVSRVSIASASKTFATPSMNSVQRTEIHRSNSSSGTEILRHLSVSKLGSRPDLFGKLTPIKGSFDQSTISLISRSTLWGRAPQCTCQYGNLKDARVPKFGMKIVYYAHGVEQVEQNGGDWTQVPQIRTIIATSATKGIWINGVHLSQQSEDGRAALFGKIYTGDIITIVNSQQPGEFLKYEAEILFGDSARARPESEKPFVIQKEFNHHARIREQSMRSSVRGSIRAEDRSLPVSTTSSAVAVI